jgi:hypothetical protein
MAADQALLDGAEYRLIGFDVDVDVLEPADLLPVTVDQMLALPFARRGRARSGRRCPMFS